MKLGWRDPWSGSFRVFRNFWSEVILGSFTLNLGSDFQNAPIGLKLDMNDLNNILNGLNLLLRSSKVRDQLGVRFSKCSNVVFVKDSILGNWPKYERRRREKNRARSASTSAEGARVRRRRKASAASLSPEAQEIPRSGIESLLLWPNSYRL